MAERISALNLEDYDLIFVEDNSINQHAVAFTGVMNTHWHSDFYSGANGCFIQLFAAPGHVNDLFPKAVMFRTRGLFQHKAAAGSELSDGSASLGCGRGGSCFRYLRPRERGRQRQRHA